MKALSSGTMARRWLRGKRGRPILSSLPYTHPHPLQLEIAAAGCSFIRPLDLWEEVPSGTVFSTLVVNSVGLGPQGSKPLISHHSV